MNKNGQLSVEFILIVLVVLILIETIIIPLRDYSEASIKDITTISYLESDAKKILQAISDLNAYSDGKLDVKLHIPEDANFYIVTYTHFNIPFSGVSYSYTLKSQDLNVGSCDSNGCVKSFELPVVSIVGGSDMNFPKKSCTRHGSFIHCDYTFISGSGYLLTEGDYVLEFEKTSNEIKVSKK